MDAVSLISGGIITPVVTGGITGPIVDLIGIRASRQWANIGQVITVTGAIKISQSLSDVGVKVEIRTSAGVLIATLVDTTYNFTTSEVLLNTINGGVDPTWTITAVEEYYLRLYLTNALLIGNKEDKEYFTVPPPDIVVETKGFGTLRKTELGGVAKITKRGGYIKPEG